MKNIHNRFEFEFKSPFLHTELLFVNYAAPGRRAAPRKTGLGGEKEKISGRYIRKLIKKRCAGDETAPKK